MFTYCPQFANGLPVFLTLCLTAMVVTAAPERGFISSQPADTWEQGLISGNGTLGANMFGRPRDEVVVFTHERLFLPMGPPVVPPDTASRLPEIRQLIDRGQYKDATRLAFDLSGQDHFMYPDPFVPAFDLNVHMEAGAKAENLMRSVDFQTGETAVRWTAGKVSFERKLFVSRADQVAVMLIRGSEPGSVDARLRLRPRTLDERVSGRKDEASDERFKSHLTGVKTAAESGFLSFRNSFTKAYPGSVHALEGIARVVAGGGATAVEGDSLVVTGADQVMLLVDITLLYDQEKPRVEATKERLTGITAAYDELLTRHARLHGALFNRMRLDLGGGKDHALTTEELLEKSTNEDLSLALLEKEFDAGRYNIISCTGELPPALQGVWGGTYQPSWAGDFTHNGNVPSAISANLMGNMPELMTAYTSYMESIVPYLEVNARHLFGARGIVLPSRSTTHGYNNALAPNFAGGFWVAGAPWAAHFFYDYYLYTGNRDFLTGHALPFMEKAALFFEDYLYEGPDGRYLFNPTTSPENSPSNTHSQGTFNATMDVAAVKELLGNLIAASGELKVNQDKIPVWQAMLKKMPDYQISEEGVVKEWLTPKLEDELNHRHSSHLYALFDGMPEEIARDPKLQAAFRKIIEIKLDRHWGRSGFMSFGVVQLGQAAASLGEGELAYRCLVHLVNRYWLNNLASMHNHRSLLNMDISGGMPAVIIKMLAASEPGRVQLLPALPAIWPTGTIEGVLCRGQIEITRLNWDRDHIRAALRSGKTQEIILETPAAMEELSVTNGKAKIRSGAQSNQRRVTLPAGQTITFDIRLSKSK